MWTAFMPLCQCGMWTRSHRSLWRDQQGVLGVWHNLHVHAAACWRASLVSTAHETIAFCIAKWRPTDPTPTKSYKLAIRHRCLTRRLGLPTAKERTDREIKATIMMIITDSSCSVHIVLQEQKLNALPHTILYTHVDVHTIYARRNGLPRFVKRPIYTEESWAGFKV